MSKIEAIAQGLVWGAWFVVAVAVASPKPTLEVVGHHHEQAHVVRVASR
jgi:hypothetical protein